MNKRIISILLCAFLILGMALPVYAVEAEEKNAVTEIHISTLDAFLQFAENCRLDSYSQNLAVYLESDIDLGGCEFESIPMFSGFFDGNGHTISGLVLENEGSVQGLFRYLTSTAVVQNLNVTGQIHPEGSRSKIGGIAGSNAGSILNCSFDGTVSGGDIVGGLVGTNAVTGIIENCRGSGEIHGNHFVGGIAGENYGVIRTCTNHAQINTTAQQNTVELSDITMDSLTDSESANTVTDIGGIAGSSSGVIRSCENHGDVGYQHMGYNIGGIAGTQSGYIVDCRNYAQSQGRKEVGGIVGQMEPAALIEYSEDTLQILQGQLNTMSGLVNRASGNAQTNASQISGQIGVLQGQAQTAKDAVDSLLPDLSEPELPDPDRILAAQNTLSNTISAIPGTLNGIAYATQNTVSTLSRDFQAVAGQISAMSETINNASENLGGSITDISDQDTTETLTGKVEGCMNYGSILADTNVGGIAGAMAMENDLDILEDWELYGEESLNFESEVRAVILNCENQGTVTGKKQNVGGIVGWQSMGLVKSSANTGTVDAENADYVGGISGISTGFIRGSNAKCAISGSTYAGGIAGCAAIVTDCRSMVQITDGKEKLGAVIGLAQDSETEKANPISGNFYLSVSEDIGAIDGISYTGCAEPLDLETFLALENLPDLFRNVTVRFSFEDGTVERITVTTGGQLEAAMIPSIPEKDGCSGQWEGLDEADLTNILFDMDFEVVYTSHTTTIQSVETRENGLPIMLVQGTFESEENITIQKLEDIPAVSEKQSVVEGWVIQLPAGGTGTQLRYLLPDGYQSKEVQIWLRDGAGTWSAAEPVEDESYLVVTITPEHDAICLVSEPADYGLVVGLAGGAFLVLCTALLLLRKKKKHRK